MKQFDQPEGHSTETTHTRSVRSVVFDDPNLVSFVPTSPSLAVVLSPCVAAVKGAYGPGHDLAKSGWTWVLELLPAARTAGYAGSDRNFRRLVVQVKKDWRVEHLVIGWGSRGGVHVFCAVLAWSRWRFVRFAADEKSTTTLAMLGECFAEIWGEVHKNGRQKMETAPRLVDS